MTFCSFIYLYLIQFFVYGHDYDSSLLLYSKGSVLGPVCVLHLTEFTQLHGGLGL